MRASLKEALVVKCLFSQFCTRGSATCAHVAAQPSASMHSCVSYCCGLGLVEAIIYAFPRSAHRRLSTQQWFQSVCIECHMTLGILHVCLMKLMAMQSLHIAYMYTMYVRALKRCPMLK